MAFDVDTLPNVSGIYKIINLMDGKFYIGSAINFRKRWNLHKVQLRQNKSHSIYLQRAWNKYGEEAFEFQIIECTTNNLLEREQYWLDLLKPFDTIGYNICKIAESRLGIKSRPEHIAKIVIANKGKEISEKQKQHLRNLRLGKKLTEEQKQARRNYRHTEEAKKKISEAGFKRWQNRPFPEIKKVLVIDNGI